MGGGEDADATAFMSMKVTVALGTPAYCTTSVIISDKKAPTHVLVDKYADVSKSMLSVVAQTSVGGGGAGGGEGGGAHGTRTHM